MEPSVQLLAELFLAVQIDSTLLTACWLSRILILCQEAPDIIPLYSSRWTRRRLHVENFLEISNVNFLRVRTDGSKKKVWEGLMHDIVADLLTIHGLASLIPVISASCSSCVKTLNWTPCQGLSLPRNFWCSLLL